MLTAHTADVHDDSEGTINDNRSAMDEGLYGTRVCQFWAECFTGSLVALPVLAASPPAVPLLPLTHRWRGGADLLQSWCRLACRSPPPYAFLWAGPPMACSLATPMPGVVASATAGRSHPHGVRTPATASVMDWWWPPRGTGASCGDRATRHRGHGHSSPAKTSPQSTPRRPAPPPWRSRSTPGSRPP